MADPATNNPVRTAAKATVGWCLLAILMLPAWLAKGLPAVILERASGPAQLSHSGAAHNF